MKRAAVVSLLLLPFVLPWCVRAETARVDIGAGLGPSSVTVEVLDGYARLTVEHANPSDAVAWVDGPDGRVEFAVETAGEWVCVVDCPVPTVRPTEQYVRLDRR